MSVAKIVRNFVGSIDGGKMFTYDDISSNQKSVVATELSRLNKRGIVKRLSRGKYYKPKKGYFGELPPDDNEVLQSFLSTPNSYITGLKVFNEMGLTTQVPAVVTIATQMQPRRIRIKNMEIQLVPSRQTIARSDIYLVQMLDALDSIHKIPDASAEDVVVYMKNYLAKLSRYALKYRPRTRALLGALLDLQGYIKYSSKLKKTLNPLSSYKVGVPESSLPNKTTWKII